MSNLYPVWWDKTVTLYNKYENPTTKEITWYRTVLKNCFWKYVGVRAINKLKSLDEASIICRIPSNDKFVEKIDWYELDETKRAELFTVGREDIVVLGEVDDIIDEYVKDMRSTDLISKYSRFDKVMTITEFSIDVGQGRACEHYRLGGI